MTAKPSALRRSFSLGLLALVTLGCGSTSPTSDLPAVTVGEEVTTSVGIKWATDPDLLHDFASEPVAHASDSIELWGDILAELPREQDYEVFVFDGFVLTDADVAGPAEIGTGHNSMRLSWDRPLSGGADLRVVVRLGQPPAAGEDPATYIVRGRIAGDRSPTTALACSEASPKHEPNELGFVGVSISQSDEIAFPEEIGLGQEVTVTLGTDRPVETGFLVILRSGLNDGPTEQVGCLEVKDLLPGEVQSFSLSAWETPGQYQALFFPDSDGVAPEDEAFLFGGDASNRVVVG